jgi:hypothetical protein
VQPGTEAGPAVRVEIDVTVHDHQGQVGDAGQHRPHRRQLAPVEGAGLVRGHLLQPRHPLVHHGREGTIRGDHERRPRAAGRRVVHIDGAVPHE